MNISGIRSFNLLTNSKSKQIKADKPYAALTAQDTTHFSGIIFSKEKREKTGKIVGQAQNTAEAGAKATAVAAAVPAAAALAPPVAYMVALDKVFGYSEEERESDRANGYADWR